MLFTDIGSFILNLKKINKMKKIVLAIYLICFSHLNIFSQVDCEKKLEKFKKTIENPSPFEDEKSILKMIAPCISESNEAQNFLGLCYLNGKGVEKDTLKAFKYIKNAAEKGYASAQYNIGRFYKYGIGCEIDYIKAKEWFEIASNNGNHKATYCLGYMYYKGIGVQQNYSKAISWFEKSEDPMAKHFLGLCYYLGYGVTANKNKALEYLSSNNTLNSKNLIKSINNNVKENNEELTDQTINSTNESLYPVNPEAVHLNKNQINSLSNSTELATIKGVWTGKLIQFDWSGKHIQKAIPIKINIYQDSITNKLKLKSLLSNVEMESEIKFENGVIYFENFNSKFSIPNLYPEIPSNKILDYNLISIDLKQAKIDNSIFLIGQLESYIKKWKEYGEPMSLILKPESYTNQAVSEEQLALNAQEDYFIKLYPVPFNSQLTVQFTLENDANVYVEMTDLYGVNKKVIQPTILLKAGDYNYNIPTTDYMQQGIYAVKVIAGNQTHTRLVIKNN